MSVTLWIGQKGYAAGMQRPAETPAISMNCRKMLSSSMLNLRAMRFDLLTIRVSTQLVDMKLYGLMVDLAFKFSLNATSSWERSSRAATASSSPSMLTLTSTGITTSHTNAFAATLGAGVSWAKKFAKRPAQL